VDFSLLAPVFLVSGKTGSGKIRLGLHLIDGIVPEPPGGAQEDHEAAANSLRRQLLASLDELASLSPEQLVQYRYDKFRQMGNFFA